MKTEIVAGIMDVARQPADPIFSETAPEHQTEHDQDTAEDDEIFAGAN